MENYVHIYGKHIQLTDPGQESNARNINVLEHDWMREQKMMTIFDAVHSKEEGIYDPSDKAFIEVQKRFREVINTLYGTD